MKLTLQRVISAQVTVNSKLIGKIGPGLLVFVSIAPEDSNTTVQKAATKIASLRIFADNQSKFNLSLLDVAGSVLVISQFTLHARIKGNRPSFSRAASPTKALKLYQLLITKLKELGLHVESGRFAAHMQVSLVNDGPVTINLDI